MADQQQQLGAPPSQQQQQQPQPQHSNVLTPAAQGGNGDSAVLCQWQGCGLRFPTAELVYDHLCEQHIGRKSTNNLNLTCAWNTCHIQLQKRDHMTSHVRVHVPLKPHHCSFCGKSFKRPQDLKKHVKTHADDTVTRAPMNNGGNIQHPNGAYNAGPQNRMPTYYGGPPMQSGPPMGYGQQNNNNNNNGSSAYYAPTQQAAQPTYGYVNYDVNQSTEVGNQASLGSRKRGYDAIDNFLGDAKRGRINFSDYASMASRLSGLQGIQLPVPNYGGVVTMAGENYANYQAAPVMMDVSGNSGGVYGPTSQQAYSLPPMTNLRTKNDLLDTQDVISRIMTSLYEHPNTNASAGIPNSENYMYTGVAERQSHSPPGIRLPRSHNGSISSAPDMMATTSNHSSTPALTPSSYHSGTSPVSMQSNHSMSPHSTAAMYPNLPTTTSTSDANGYMTSNMATTPTLGNQFDYDNRQRYGGGRLQKAAPPPRSIDDKINGSENHVATAKKALSTSSEETETTKSETRPLSRLSNSAIDPALSGLTSPSAMIESETVADKAQEVWVENVRLVEFLKKVVDRMLEDGEYEGGAAEKAERGDEENASLYPTLREMAGSG